jgi:hypothetical protein
MRTIFPILILLGLLSTLPGCIGLGAWTLGSRVDSSERSRISEHRGSADLHKPPLEEGIREGAELRRYWGAPDRVVSDAAGQEEWIYKTGGWRWAGMLLYVILVPLPAMVPVGSQEISFTLIDGHIAQTTRMDWAFKAGAYCGYFGMMYGGLACGTGTLEEATGSEQGS